MTAEHGVFLAGCGLLILWGLWMVASGVRTMVTIRRARRPFDWEKDAPEYRCAKDAHVKRLP
jgi:hypothetical protein